MNERRPQTPSNSKNEIWPDWLTQTPPSDLDASNALIEEVLTGKRNKRGIPTFKVSQISKIPANKTVIMDIMNGLNPEGRPVDPVKLLHGARRLIVPDYTPHGYIVKGQPRRLASYEEHIMNLGEELAVHTAVEQVRQRATREAERTIVSTPQQLKPGVSVDIQNRLADFKDQTENIASQSKANPYVHIQSSETAIPTRSKLEELEAINDVEKRREVFVNAQIKKTSDAIQKRIHDLVGFRNRILDTYQVGNIEVTCVVPDHRIDPLYCQNISGDPMQEDFNFFMRVGFINAYAGKLFNSSKQTLIAQDCGRLASIRQFITVLRGAPVTLAEVLFSTEITHSRMFVDGFTRFNAPGRRIF